MRSIPKSVKITGHDKERVIYKNMGNNHTYPMMFTKSVTMEAAATSVTVTDGVKFHGLTPEDNGTVVITQTSTMNAADATANVFFYVKKDTATNKVTIEASAAVTDAVTFDVIIFMGAQEFDTSSACRGNNYLPE